MTLEQLRIFVAVAEREHMTEASRVLNIVQSAVSHAIATLEAEFGLKLFNRVGRRIELTEAGRLFAGEARAVLARAAAARRKMTELGALEHGSLLIHASQTIASYWLPARLKRFRTRYPAIDIRLLIGNTGEVARSIHDGMADLGFIEGSIADPELEETVVAHDQMVLVVSPEHPWTRSDRVEPDTLVAGDWVLREPGSGTRSEFEGALRAVGIQPEQLRVAMELPSNEAVRAAVEAGLGASVLSASVVASALEAELLHAVPFDLPVRAFSAVRHRERYFSCSAAALLEILS
jgi:DNA-binding transcriptional LysR family regulator